MFPAPSALSLMRLRRVTPTMPLTEFRVAMVVTKAPSEPWDLVMKTLRAMLEQSYGSPYDVWLCDEDPNEVTRQWCDQHGVHLSTRHGVAGLTNPVGLDGRSARRGTSPTSTITGATTGMTLLCNWTPTTSHHPATSRRLSDRFAIGGSDTLRHRVSATAMPRDPGQQEVACTARQLCTGRNKRDATMDSRRCASVRTTQ